MDSETQLLQLQQDFGTAQFFQNWVAQDWCYWDKVYYNTAGINEYQFFTLAAGANDPNGPTGNRKTTEDTNLTTSGQTGGNECFIWTSLQLSIQLCAKARQTGTGVASDTNYIARQLPFARFAKQLSGCGALTVTIMQKKWLIEDSPFLRFPPGWGLGEVFVPVIGTGAATAINGGANAYVAPSIYDFDGGDKGDPFSFGQPVFLAPNTTFDIKLASVSGNFPASTNLMGPAADQVAILQLMCVMKGWKVRPRQ